LQTVLLRAHLSATFALVELKKKYLPRPKRLELKRGLGEDDSRFSPGPQPDASAALGGPFEKGDGMAFKRLSVDEMLKLSLPWVSPGEEANIAILKNPLLAALFPHLQVAHVGVYSVTTRAENQKAWRLSEQACDLDARHDELVRGIHGSLTMLAQTTDLAEEYLRLRDLVLPEGLVHTNKTYREESVHAAITAARIDGSTRACLRAINFNEQNLDDLVSAWLATAKKLGELEEERARLSPTSAALAAEINMARLRWIRTVNTLVASSLLVNLDAHTDKTLFGDLRQAERTANTRSGERPEGFAAGSSGSALDRLLPAG
jgi:hypothetical protein